MDFARIIENCLIISADIIILSSSYAAYKLYSNSVKNLQEASILKLDDNLLKKVEASGGIIPYAVVFGKVKALTTPLYSTLDTYASGVMQDTSTQEYKIMWIPLMNIWRLITDSPLSNGIIPVPFCLYNKLSIFKKTCIEITEPLLAKNLTFTKMGGKFVSRDISFKDAFVPFVLKEHTLGHQYVENMLLEETPLTAVGKIIIENNKLKMVPPDNGLLYYLTPLSYDSLLEQTQILAFLHKLKTVLLSALTLVLLAHYLTKGFYNLRLFINDLKDKKKRLAMRKTNRSAETSSNDNDMKCVICLELPVEIVVLECGHACLCLDCAERVRNRCPVCQSIVSRLVPVYLP